MKLWFSNVLKSGRRLAFPFINFPGLQMTGMRIKDMINNAKNQLACQEALASRYPSAAWITMMDLSAEAEAFGSKVLFNDNEVPTVTGSVVESARAASSLRIPAIGSKRTGVYLEAASLVSSVITDRPVFGCHIGPLSLAGRLFDVKAILLKMIREPEMVHTVLEKCTEFLRGYSRSFKRAGVNGVVIAEPVAGLLSPVHCDMFSSRYVRMIVDAVQDDNFSVILHNCGNTAKLVPSMLSTGARGLHFGNAVPMTDILPQIPDTVITMGNIDPAGVFKIGNPDDVELKTRELLDTTSGYRNYIISSGCDIPPGSPLANIDAFFGAVKEYNNDRKSYESRGLEHVL